MKLPVQSEGGSFEKCPAGNHLAVCYEVLDLGTQEVLFDGEKQRKHQIWIGWETPAELMEDGRPYVIGRRYTLSSHEKSKLREDLTAWRGKPFSDDDFGNFEISSIIGAGCFLNVVHVEKGDKTYANIKGVAALPKGTETPAIVNQSTAIDLDETFDVNAFGRLSDHMQSIIAMSPEYKALNGKAPKVSVPVIDETDDNETPF